MLVTCGASSDASASVQASKTHGEAVGIGEARLFIALAQEQAAKGSDLR
jgi:hypothetical protein